MKYLTICFLLLIYHNKVVCQSNTKKIVGHWDAYAFDMNGRKLNADSIQLVEADFWKVRIKNNPDRVFTAQDTQLVKQITRETLESVTNSYWEFTANGKVIQQIGFDKDEDGKPPRVTGTYKWTGDNMLTTKDITGETPYKILELTESELVLTINSDEENVPPMKFLLRKRN